jgi:hypothetical protein
VLYIAIVITGAPGAGKSATLEALSDLLSDSGIEHGALELEQLAWGHPWLGLVDTLPQLQSLLASQRQGGRRVHLISATTETAEELDALMRAIEADRALVVALQARSETVAARVLARESEHWAGRERLAAKARELATMIPALAKVDVVIKHREWRAGRGGTPPTPRARRTGSSQPITHASPWPVDDEAGKRHWKRV